MEKKSKKSIIIGITLLLLVTLTLLGLTYAYYRTRIIGNEANTSVSVTSQKLEVTYQNESALVSATGIEPGGEAIVKTFEVANTGNATATYSVWLEDMTNTFERNDDLTYTLTKNGESVEGTLDHIAAGTHQILIPSVSINAESTDSYTLTINYKNEEDIDQSEDMGSTLQFKINIGEEAVTWENSTEGTLLYSLKNASDVGTTMGSTEDDYGISHYYTGAVTNNYVTYSNMFWRILRVQGDGTIKLILADENYPCSENVDADENDNFLGYNTDNSYSAAIANGSLNFSYKENSTFSESDLVYEDSDIPNVLNAWKNGGSYNYSNNRQGTFEQKISSKDQLLLSYTDWCNDLSIETINEEAEGWIVTNYGGQMRWFNETASLKCNFKGLNNTKSLRVTNNIGMITVDEIILATESGFLETNATGTLYWTMTPSYLTNDPNIYMIPGRELGGAADVRDVLGIRPVIAVRSDVTITEGDNGTQSNPYVIG